MALWKTPKKPTNETHLKNKKKKKRPQISQNVPKPEKQQHQQQPSWKGIFSCKDLHTLNPNPEEATKKSKKLKCSGSLCSNTKVMQYRPAEQQLVHSNSSPEVLFARKLRASSTSSSSSTNPSIVMSGGSSRSMKPLLPNSSNVVTVNGGKKGGGVVVSSNSSSSPFKGMPFSRFSGCYECRMVVDPVLGFTKDSALRNSICACPDCGEIFMKAETLELHQAVKHAVSELGAEDTSKNIVEIIFQSSWLKMESPICKIERILKVHNTQRTITKFEEYRDSIKSKATNLFPKKHPRCIADGNELLRFHSTTFACSLGLNGSSTLCSSSAGACHVCSIIKNGFAAGGDAGILTTATSGKAHDKAAAGLESAGKGGEKRAMLVCRVIAGRVMKKSVGGTTAGEEGVVGKGEGRDEYDSVAGGDVGVYSNLDELHVFNPMAILPCFVVIYCGF